MPMNSRSPTPTIDNGVAFANDLFLFGWVYPRSEPVVATFVDARGRRAKLNVSRSEYYARPDVKQALRQTSASDDLYGFVCVVELADLIGFALHDGEVEITIETRDGHSASGKVRVQSASSDRQSPEFYELLNLGAKLGLLQPKLANYLAGVGARRADAVTRYAIDAACKSNSGFLTEGWIENARSRKLSFLSSDGLSYVAASDVIFRTRADVSDHLRNEKCAVLTEDHGVVLNFPHCHPGTSSFVILAEEHDAYVPVVQIDVTFSEDRGRLLQVASQTGGIGKLPRPDQAKKLFRPFFVESESTNEYSVLPIKTASSRPTVSIIVPFYGEYRFIFSLLTMQKRFSSDFEWIFVSDEPAKHQVLTLNR